MKKILIAVFFAFSCSVITVAGQTIMSNPVQWYTNNQINSMNIFNRTVSNSIHLKKMTGGRARTGSGSARSGSAPRTSASKTIAPVNFALYKENPANSLIKLAAAKAGSDAERAETQQTFEYFINLYKQTARADGLPANDLAYAFGYFVVNNYSVYNDLMDVPYEKDPRAKRGVDGFDRISIMSDKKLLMVKPYQEQAIYQQFQKLLADSPEMKTMTDAQKQQAAELCAVMVGVNVAAYMKGVNDENDAMLDQARQLAKDGLEKLIGVSADKIKIGNEGLEL